MSVLREYCDSRGTRSCNSISCCDPAASPVFAASDDDEEEEEEDVNTDDEGIREEGKNEENRGADAVTDLRPDVCEDVVAEADDEGGMVEA